MKDLEHKISLNVRRRRNGIDIQAYCVSRIVVAALAAVDADSPNYRIVLVDILVLRTKIPSVSASPRKLDPFEEHETPYLLLRSVRRGRHSKNTSSC